MIHHHKDRKTSKQKRTHYCKKNIHLDCNDYKIDKIQNYADFEEEEELEANKLGQETKIKKLAKGKKIQ